MFEAQHSHRQALSNLGAALAALIPLGAPAHAETAATSKIAVATSPGDLQPPRIQILRASAEAERGLIFIAPKFGPGIAGQQGPEIVDDQGRPVWFHALAGGDQAADFRVQQLRGEPVLTWTQGQGLGGVPTTPVVDYVVDRAYRIVATVRAGNGLNADQHELRLTPHNTALIVIYNPVPYDLSPFGGPSTGKVVDGVVQEIDVASGRVLFEWHSLDHVGLDESHAPVPAPAAVSPYDYFHINAVNLDEDGNLLISARNTWAIYKVSRRSGEVQWRLGGTKSNFALGEGVQFAWQHDPEPVDRDTVRIFDNEAGPAVLPQSRVIWVRHDRRRHVATLVRSIVHPDGLSAPSQGNSQALEDGHTFVGWGQLGRFSEFDGEGNLLFDASTPTGYDNYRSYRFEWHARPTTPPVATAHRNPDGTTTVHAIWNGATDVARWQVVGGPGPHSRGGLGSADWSGLDTSINIATRARQIAVIAEDAQGRVLGRSDLVAVGD